MKSEFLISLVEARKPAVLTTAPGPNRMPSRLMRKMRPFAVRLPRISDGPSPPVTRLSATDPLLGCWKGDALAAADIERIPVDDRAVARLIDRYRGTALSLDRGGATDDRAARRPARSRPHA